VLAGRQEPHGFLGGNGIVGGGITIALGAAFSAKYRKTKEVAVTFFGEGAANQGTFHETLNLASLWKLPLIAVCENNCYAATTPVEKSSAVIDIASRANGYGIPGIIVDGNDCLAVYSAAAEAVGRARQGKGPTLLECKTYRIEPHCGIIADLRPKGEREKWQNNSDPIQKLIDIIPEKEKAALEKIDLLIADEIIDAIKFAEESPGPEIKKMIEEFAGL
jgi:pyruvate dehydrogenase E1 component alpha subunit